MRCMPGVAARSARPRAACSRSLVVRIVAARGRGLAHSCVQRASATWHATKRVMQAPSTRLAGANGHSSQLGILPVAV